MEAVEHVWPEGMARGQKGMVEVVGLVVRHPDALHDPLRTLVDDCREGDDLVEAQLPDLSSSTEKATAGILTPP